MKGDHFVTFEFGYYKRNGKTKLHKGLDLISGERSNVLAVADGVVVACANNIKGTNKNTGTLGMGNYVVLQHTDSEGNIWQTRYQHMEFNSVVVKKGNTVKAGQKLGIIGNTGYSTGRHLHFDVRTKKHQADGIYASGWYFVSPKEYIQGKRNFKKLKAVKQYKVTANALNVRSTPSTAGRKVGLIYKGHTFTSDTTKNGWVQYGTNKWVAGNHLKEV